MGPVHDREGSAPVQADGPVEGQRGGTVPRRRFLGGVGGLVAALSVPGCVSRAARVMAEGGVGGALYAYVGCYSTPDRDGNGEGINLYRMDPASGRWSHVQLVAGLENPSFLALDRRQRFLYSVHGGRTYATAFVIDPESGRLTRLNQQDVGGENPVHLAVDATNRFLVVSNYGSGSMVVLPINADGSLAPRSELVELEGTPGPHPTRQTSSNPHHNPFDPGGRFLVVPDLGLDRLFVFRLDTATGALVPADPPFVATRPGAGPRHVDFHPSLPYAYVINELDSTVATYPVRCGPRGAEPAAGVLHVTVRFHRAEHVRGDQGAPWGCLSLWLEPGSQQHRDLRRGPEERPGDAGGLGVHSGRATPVLRARSDRDAALRVQSGE